MASGNVKEHIVFDVVNNVHRNAVFNNALNQHKKNTTSNDIGSIVNKGTKHTTDIPTDDTTSGDDNDTKPKGKSGGGGGRTSTGGDNTITKPKGKNSDGGITDPHWYKNINDISPEDMKFTSHMATYREQIAKLVAEPMQMRCKEAFEAHFKRWCKMNNVPYPISNKKLKEVYNLDKADFVEYFEKIIRENKINYPMRDAEKLLEIGKKRQDGLPIDVFARWKNISVAQILDLLEVS